MDVLAVLSKSSAQSNATRTACEIRLPSDSRASMRPQRDTYTAYSIGCAVVWGVILLLGRRRLDARTWYTLRVVCGGWWMGWTSASIARIGYPPPKPLTPAGEKRLRAASIVLVALGLVNTIRMLVAGKRPRESEAGFK